MGSVISPEIQENRERVLTYLRVNPQGFVKIDLVPAAGHGRCLIGMVCEALDFPLDGYEYTEDRQSAYDFAAGKVATEDQFMWGISDTFPGKTWETLANILEKVWADKEYVFEKTVDMHLS
jgi:hypothetical protein